LQIDLNAFSVFAVSVQYIQFQINLNKKFPAKYPQQYCNDASSLVYLKNDRALIGNLSMLLSPLFNVSESTVDIFVQYVISESDVRMLFHGGQLFTQPSTSHQLVILKLTHTKKDMLIMKNVSVVVHHLSLPACMLLYLECQRSNNGLYFLKILF